MIATRSQAVIDRVDEPEVRRPARLHGATRTPRAADASRCDGVAEARDHGDLRPYLAGRRTRAAVRASDRLVDAAAREPVRHRRAGRGRHGAGLDRRVARHRHAAVATEGARAAARLEGRGPPARDAEVAARHGAARRPQAAVSAGGRRRARRRPVDAADPDLLARRRGTADHVGPRRHARPATRAASAHAAEPRHLSTAGDRARPGHDALARASRRRARLPRTSRARSRASRSRSPSRSAPIRRPCSAP